MLRILRNIRQSIVVKNSNNKDKPQPASQTSRYIKYALGEIILVVIGILIALQVNNMNEQRKLDNKVETLLPQLKLQVEKNLVNVSDIAVQVDEGYQKSIEILNNLKSNSLEFPQKQLDSLIIFTGTDYVLNLDMLVVDQARLNGSLSLIKSDSLNKYIYTFLQYHNDTLERERIISDDLRDNLKPFLNTNYSITNLMVNYGYDAFKKTDNFSDSNIKLRNHPEFENLMVTRIMYLDDLYFFYSELQYILNKLKEHLEVEIAEYE